MNSALPKSSSAPNRLRWVTLFVLTSLNILNYVDRNIFAALIPAMQKDLHFTDTEMGWLGSAFILSYTLIAPLFGYLGDRGNRTKTMSAGLLLWSGATALTGSATTLVTQFATRVTVGFGEAAYSVISPTIIADHFPKAVRGRAFAFYSCAIPVGSALGYVMGGWLEPLIGWHRAFYVVGVPGLVLVGVLLFLRDPERGAQESPEEQALAREEKQMPFTQVYAKLFKNGGFLFTVLGYAAYTFVLGGISFWMPTYIVRYFDGVTAARGNIVFGGVTVVGGFFGTVVGGWLADRVERRSGNGYMKVAVLSMVLSVPLFAYLLTVRDFTWFSEVLFILDLVLFMCISPLDAAVVGSVRPALRASAMALNVFLIHVLGDGISRVMMGAISDKHGLAAAIAFCPYVLALAGALWFIGMILYWQPLVWPVGALAIPRFQAHRGYRMNGAQENTLDAFRAAHALGAEMCECDVQVTSDGAVVVFHDADLKRLGGSGDLVRNISREAMATRANSPDLCALLSDPQCPHKVNIELKTGEARGHSGLEKKVVDIVRECQAEHRVLFSSFNPLALGRIARLAPEIPRALLVTEEQDPANKIYLRRMWLGAFARPHLLHLDQDMISRERMDHFNDRHVKVAAWTVNDVERATELTRLGVISLITDKLYAP